MSIDLPEESEDLQTHINLVVGANNKQYYPLICSHCDKELIEIFVKDYTEITKSYAANCPHCGDKTFKRKITGKYIIMLKPDVMLLDIEEDESSVNFKLGEVK